MMKRIFLVLLLITAGFITEAQSNGSVSRKVKKAEQKKENIKRQQQKSAVKGSKRHESIQTKATRKRMHKHRKQPIHVDAYERKPFFLKRWFRKKEHGS